VGNEKDKDDRDRSAMIVTDEMVRAAEKELWEQASKFDMRSLDELHHDTIRRMIEAAVSRMRAS